MLAAACAALPSVGLPPRSGTAPMTKPFTEASNLPLSPLVALLAIGTMSPAVCSGDSLWMLLPCMPVRDTMQATFSVRRALSEAAMSAAMVYIVETQNDV